MSYSSQDKSVAQSQPIELLDFYTEGGIHWRYNSSAVNVVFQGETFAATVCKRKDLELTSSTFKNKMTISLGRRNNFTTPFIAAPVEEVVHLVIYRLQGTDYVYYWSGLVISVKFDGDGVATVNAEPKTSSVLRCGRRRRCQILCGRVLYDAGCNVTASTYSVVGTVASVTGILIGCDIFGTKPDGWFSGGKLVFGRVRRLIVAHTGTQITLSRHIPSIVFGSNFTAYAGCLHTPSCCETKFANKLNYGGQEFLPLTNPFQGKRIL